MMVGIGSDALTNVWVIVYEKRFFMSPNTTEYLLKLHGEIDVMLKQSLVDVKSNETNESYLAYREVVMDILEISLLKLINPLCRQHPNLMPAGLTIPDSYMKKEDKTGL
jgi:hypothetical protein